MKKYLNILKKIENSILNRMVCISKLFLFSSFNWNKTFMKLSPRPLVKPCSYKYFGYTSNQTIEMKWQFVTELRAGETTVQAPLVIAKGQHECQTKCQTAKLLQVIKINLDPQGSTPIQYNFVNTERLFFYKSYVL